ncbi:MAG: Cysteine desulfurase IscS [Alphaproteobacteria bacterium MarineAlpha6_Bin6]|nr:IscS subfamily cysteine desulfurase [Pelagibacteraceae bacterium]PPR32140.1 MAG: Cysteine desulfurase IscS [Alphaproteobacteria bacterium MarineAlpha6_Bin6]PPR32799.1 MAG: Cysteine desulfurase IscS [Alphaproteobacteria bacterium MarineAlpha6_Bin5]|tara:strand:- start:371 stop:1507 length:1137 start_codon:yes stop_codon:yes gene_type:complete
MGSKNIYLDNHSSTQLDKRVFNQMKPFFTNFFGNPHSESHSYGWRSNKFIDISRDKIAKSINANKEEIFFTSGATESNNLILKGLAFSQKKKNHIITCVTEHKCILESCKFLEAIGYKVTYLKVNKFGQINLNDLKKNINKNTFLVTIMHVNNEIGTIHPIKSIGDICKKNGVFFHTDASQSLGKIKFDINYLNIDFASFSSHKIYGPQGIGALFIRKKNKVKLTPLFSGGGQENGLRSGTLPTALCVGFGYAIELAEKERVKNMKKIKNLKKIFLNLLQKNKVDFILNGKDVIENNINITFPKTNGDLLFSKLDDISISSGSACGSGSGESSYVLKELGINKNNAKSTLRIGIGKNNTKNEMIYFGSKILKILDDRN